MAKAVNATVSHEMMTPLNCIITFAEILKTGILSPEQLRIVSLVKKTSKILKMNLKDLLDRNLLERGILEPNLELSRLEDLLDEV